MRTLIAGWSCGLLLLAAGPAQQPFECTVVADGAVVALAALWPAGIDGDPPAARGLARAVWECRLRAARAAAGPAAVVGGDVDGSTAVLFVAVPAEAGDGAVRALAAALGNGPAPDDDSLRLAIARAALCADDEASVLPGTMLGDRARAWFFAGLPQALPAGGDAAAIAGLSPAVVRAQLAAPGAMRVAALGAFPDALRAQLATLLADRPVAGGIAVRPGAVAASGRALQQDGLARSDAPYVAAAVAAPVAPDPVWLVAVAVAQARAQRLWKPRRAEAAVRAPFVDWSWQHQEPVLLVHRRGHDLRQLLPGERAADAAAEVAATAAEIEALLADLRARAPTADELAAAVQTLGAEGADGRAGIAACEGRAAGVWLVARLRRAVRGIDLAACARVVPEQVQAVLRGSLQSDRVCWHALAPNPRPGHGYPLR